MKKLLSFALALAMTLSLVACSATASPSPSQPAPTQEVSAFPVTVTDHLGREVTINEKPDAIVSGYYISTSLLIALGCTDRLVGVEAKADTREIYKLSAPSILELPSVGTAKKFDLEGCAALEPDLVVLPAKLKDVIPTLEELGIPVLAVKPEDQALLEECVTMLGKATGTSDRADALLTWTHDQLDGLAAALKDAEAPKVYLASNSDLLSTAGAPMYQNSLILQAGGANVAAELTEDYWAAVSYEQILTWDPEYIILAADASYDEAAVLTDPALAGCSAIENGQVFHFPNDIEAWDSPVPGGALGILWLANTLHPDLYSVEDFRAAEAEFYQTFYGFSVPADLT